MGYQKAISLDPANRGFSPRLFSRNALAQERLQFLVGCQLVRFSASDPFLELAGNRELGLARLFSITKHFGAVAPIQSKAVPAYGVSAVVTVRAELFAVLGAAGNEVEIMGIRKPAVFGAIRAYRWMQILKPLLGVPRLREGGRGFGWGPILGIHE